MAYLTFVLGGARSGKTARAMALTPTPRAYVATAEPRDGEMAERISLHQAERGDDWGLIEAPLELPRVVAEAPTGALMIDCLTLWLSNLFAAEHDIAVETEALIAAIAARNGEVIVVSNEIGLGLVPMEPLSRNFRDAQGRLNQRVAAAADCVEFVAAGLPLKLK